MDAAEDKSAKSIEIGGKLIAAMNQHCQGVHIMAIGWENRIPATLKMMVYTLVEPEFRPGTGFPIHWLDITLPVVLLGIWLFLFVRNLRSRALLPVNDRQSASCFLYHAAVDED